MTVNAEDIEIIPVNDPGTWAAFRWFYQYGFESDFSSQETQTYSTSESSTITGEFSFSGQFSGSLSATVSLTGTGTIKTGSQGNTFWSSTSESGLMYDSTFNGIQMTISPNANGATNDYNATYACVYNAQSTAANAVMTCTPDASTSAQPLTLPNQTITIDKVQFNTAGSIQTDLFLSLLHEETEVGTMSGSLSGSIGGGGTITLGQTGTATTTTTNNQKYSFTMPYTLRKTNFPSGGLTYSNNYIFKGSADNPFVIYWMSDSRALYSMSNLYKSGTKESVPASKVLWFVKIIYGTQNLIINGVEYSGTDNAWMDFDGRSYNITNKIIYPLYVGYKNSMSDELYRFIYGSDRTIEKIDDQIAADQQHHDEMMDTSDSAQISTDGDALIDDADEKFGDLFFPLQHAIDTADDLANVQATGTIRLPAIFKDDYWYLDLTVFERKLPQAWAFIQSLCQLAVAIYLIHGLYSLFFGGKEEDDS